MQESDGTVTGINANFDNTRLVQVWCAMRITLLVCIGLLLATVNGLQALAVKLKQKDMKRFCSNC